VAGEAVAELVEEGDPAFLDVAVDVLPFGGVEVAGLDRADQGPVAEVFELDDAVV
jgi:hypothetical protein